MKKVLLIKLEAPSYSSIGMETAFKEAFEEVRSIDWQRVRFNFGLEELWKQIVNQCVSFKPDLIFCQFQKGDILQLWQWKILSEYGFVINYTEDVREDISWYEEVGEFIGLTIFTNEDDVKRFKHSNVGYMMVSYNHIWYKPQPKTEKYYGDIVFVGNNYVNTNLNFPFAEERQEMITFMKGKFGDKFQAYGVGQENQMLSPASVIEAYNNCKVVITQNNFHKTGYCSDRGMNAIGCGALVVHQYFNGIQKLFNDAPTLYAWRDFSYLYAVCNSGIRINPTNKTELNNYTIKNHSWLARIKRLNELIKTFSNKKEESNDEISIQDVIMDEMWHFRVSSTQEKCEGIVSIKKRQNNHGRTESNL